MHRIVLASLLLISGCSGNYQFSSNLDPEPIEGYFAPANVQLLTAKPAEATSKGFVSGDSCQTKSSLPPANEADARTELRRQAAEKGANAVIVQQCITLAEVPGCVSAIQCSGEAVQLSQ